VENRQLFLVCPAHWLRLHQVSACLSTPPVVDARVFFFLYRSMVLFSSSGAELDFYLRSLYLIYFFVLHQHELGLSALARAQAQALAGFFVAVAVHH
jgi:hypothetical protein